MWNNILKGWLLSAIGLIIIAAAIAYFFGFLPIKETGVFLPKAWEIGIAFLVGLILLIVPPTVIEKKATDILDRIDFTIIKKSKDE